MMKYHKTMYKSADTLYYTNLIVKNVTITIYLYILHFIVFAAL